MTQLTMQQSFDLALHHHRAGRPREAEQIYRQILAQQPKNADAMHFLGLAVAQQGNWKDAVGWIRAAIGLRSNWPEAHYNLGKVLKDMGLMDDAVAAFRQAIALRPGYVQACLDLANTLVTKGQFHEAIACYRQSIALGPGSAETYFNLGLALFQTGQSDEAIAAYRQATTLGPGYAEAYSNLGNAMMHIGSVDGAITAYRQAIALKPAYADVHSNLGIALKEKGQLDEAIAAFRQAIALNPDLPEAHSNLGNILKETGQLDEAISACRRAVTARPSLQDGHSNLLYARHYQANLDVSAIAEEHTRWSRQHAEPLVRFIQPHTNDRNPDRRLRIGYVSPDFRGHSVASLLLPLLECHDRREVEVFCYAQVSKADEMTGRIRAQADHWRGTVGLSDDQMADLIRQDQVDILVDLAGHTAGNRLLVFARKPAPVQVTWLGYPNTTGLTTIDYRLTDAHADPPGAGDTLHSEQLIRLPRTNWIYQAPENCPEADANPAPVRFGCFNNFAKVTEPMLKVWSRILKAVPGSTLLLKSKGLGSAEARGRVHRIFEAEGIPPARIELMGWEPSGASHLAMYHRIAIALDPFPYHGTATTCEALWMGVPVVTLAGKIHVSRVGVSLLTNVGLAELIAGSEEDYVRIAVELAGDLPRLNHLHLELRGRMRQSPLMDAPAFARNMEAEYRRMWRKWCQTASDSG